jgi:hypothetical protein
MKLKLQISEDELADYCGRYLLARESDNPRQRPRLPMAAWVARAIVSEFSKATSQKGCYAVEQTLRPIFEEQVKDLLGAK